MKEAKCSTSQVSAFIEIFLLLSKIQGNDVEEWSSWNVHGADGGVGGFL